MRRSCPPCAFCSALAKLRAYALGHGDTELDEGLPSTQKWRFAAAGQRRACDRPRSRGSVYCHPWVGVHGFAEVQVTQQGGQTQITGHCWFTHDSSPELRHRDTAFDVELPESGEVRVPVYVASGQAESGDWSCGFVPTGDGGWMGTFEFNTKFGRDAYYVRRTEGEATGRLTQVD